MDAFMRGVTDGLGLYLNIIASLIAFTAFVALINIMPLVVAIQQHFHGYIIFHCAFFVWGDFYLVFLQRYHRLRIWQTAQKLRERIARKEKRKEVTA